MRSGWGSAMERSGLYAACALYAACLGTGCFEASDPPPCCDAEVAPDGGPPTDAGSVLDGGRDSGFPRDGGGEDGGSDGGTPDAGVTCVADEWDHDGDAATPCRPWTMCGPGSFVATVGSPTTDRACASCPAGSTSTEPNQLSCDSVGACPLGSQSNGQLGCAPCGPGFFCPGNTSAQACAPHQRWDDDQDPSTACAAWTVCTAGSAVAMAGTATSDRGCTPCTNGFSTSDNAPACTPWQDCVVGDYVLHAGTPTEDRECDRCAPGSTSTEPNQSVCEGCGAGTEPSEQGCTACSEGTFCPGGAAAVTCDTEAAWDHDGDASTSCAPWTSCPWGTEQEGDALNDRECYAEPLWQWRDNRPLSRGQVSSMRFLGDDIIVASNFAVTQNAHIRWQGRVARASSTGTVWNLTRYSDVDGNTHNIGLIEIDSAGNVFVPAARVAYSPLGTAFGVVASFDSFGNERWTRSDVNHAWRALTVSDDGVVTAVGSNSGLGARVQATSDTGTPGTLLQLTTGPSDSATSIARTPTGDFIVAASVGAGFSDVLLAGISRTNAIQWTTQFGSTSTESEPRVLVLADGSCVVAGTTFGTLPGQVSGGGGDGFLAFYDPATSVLTLRQFGGPGEERVKDLAIDENGTLYVVGTVSATGLGIYATFLEAFAAGGEPLWTRLIQTDPLVEGSAVIVDATRIAVGGFLRGLATQYDNFTPGDAIVVVFPRP